MRILHRGSLFKDILSKRYFTVEVVWPLRKYLWHQQERNIGGNSGLDISQFQAMGDGNEIGDYDLNDTKAPLNDRLEQRN